MAFAPREKCWFCNAPVYAALLTLLLWAAPRGFADDSDSLPDPRKAGAYPVGVTTIELVDHSRTDNLTQGPRTLLTEIWYPATDDSKDLPKNTFSDFFLRGAVPQLDSMLKSFFKVELKEIDARFKNNAVRDARMRDGKFPLIVFSHGNGGIRSQNAFWCDHMASHGYIVMAPDHTGNCAATVVGGKVIPYNVGKMFASAQDRPKDVKFLIDSMAHMSRGADSRFTGRVDLDKIGVAGHSYGGYTSAAVIESDPRVKAIIPMTPVWPSRANYTTPLLMFLASEDSTLGLRENERSRKRFEETKGAHYLVEVIDGGHFTFTDMFQADPNFGDGVGRGKRITQPDVELTYLPMESAHELTNAYSIAFFGVYVRGQEGYRKFLSANQYPGKILYKNVERVAESEPASAAVDK